MINDIGEETYPSQLPGHARLWGAVLRDIWDSLTNPIWQGRYESALSFVLNREGTFDLMAQCLGEYPADLQRRILRAMENKGLATVPKQTRGADGTDNHERPARPRNT